MAPSGSLGQLSHPVQSSRIAFPGGSSRVVEMLPKSLSLPTALLLFFTLNLVGCATAEQGADQIANTAVQGLEGKGHLYTEKVMKDDMGNDFQ